MSDTYMIAIGVGVAAAATCSGWVAAIGFAVWLLVEQQKQKQMTVVSVPAQAPPLVVFGNTVVPKEVLKVAPSKEVWSQPTQMDWETAITEGYDDETFEGEDFEFLEDDLDASLEPPADLKIPPPRKEVKMIRYGDPPPDPPMKRVDPVETDLRRSVPKPAWWPGQGRR